ncbi:BspA family leucine-rich repeat surface protein, partial [Listeria monocytogenes]|nr:BspA family leucine-rich repeat surface protein [Listeria monocytogenes]
MKKFSMRVVLIISVLFIAFGSANVSTAQERDTTNKLPEVELDSLDTSNIIAEEVAQEKPVEVEQLEEIPTTDELMQNPDILEKSVADSDDPDLTVVSSGAYWRIYRNTANGEYSMRMFGNVPSSIPSAWKSYLSNIKHIEIEEATLTGSFETYFKNKIDGFRVLESVRIERSNLSGVTSFREAFFNPILQKVIIRDNDYPTVPSLLTMESMFENSYNLTELDVSGLDTSAVTNMKNMFYKCSVLKELDLSNWDTSAVNNMNSMFGYCESLEKLNVSNFDTSSVNDMYYMFRDCKALEKLDVSNFDTSSVTNMAAMFVNSTSLKELDVSNFDTSSATTMQAMFSTCRALEKLDLSNFDTSSVTNMAAMFAACNSLEELDLSNFDTSSVTNMQGMFFECSSLEELDVSNFDTSSVTNMQQMFFECSSLEELDLSNFDTSLVTDMDRMFINCAALKSLYLDNFTTAKTMTDMFTGTTSLTYLFVSHNLKSFYGLANTSWYDEKNWVQLSNYAQLQTYHQQQSEPTGYRKGTFLSLTMD